MASHTLVVVRDAVVLVLGTAAIATAVIWTIKKSGDPARTALKWVLTVPVILYVALSIAPRVSGEGMDAAFAVLESFVCGLILAIIWRRNLADLLANPVAALFDGGTQPPVPHPAYSVAMARQKQGKFLEAVIEIRHQLAKFPDDVEGQLMLAQIQAEDLHDLPAAELTVQHFCAQPGHAPANIAFALSSLADWYLQNQDSDAARLALEKIQELLPDSEHALGAAQRIAHLGTREMLLGSHDRKKFAVAEGPQNLGLLRGEEQPKALEADPEQLAADYVRHLQSHPLDTEAREKLAVLYADHYGRLDLAADQLEEMIGLPNQPARLVARWLNLLADLQIRHGTDYETVRQTIERIVERTPNLAAAEVARNRLARLKLELKGKQQNRAVQMGTYAQNLGLKGNRENNTPPENDSSGAN
jgi:hypothetical protein